MFSLLQQNSCASSTPVGIHVAETHGLGDSFGGDDVLLYMFSPDPASGVSQMTLQLEGDKQGECLVLLAQDHSCGFI